MKKLILFLFFLTIFSITKAQDKKTYRDITKKYQQGLYFLSKANYESALNVFLSIDSVFPNNYNIYYHIGLSYLGMPANKAKAIPYLEVASKHISNKYEEIIECEEAPLETYYKLALAYRLSYQPEKAIDNYVLYKKYYPFLAFNKNHELDLEIEKCYNVKRMMQNPVVIKIDNLGSNINTKYPEYSPVVTADDATLIFTSRREGSTGGLKDSKGKYYEDIFISHRAMNGAWGLPSKIGPNINTDMHEASISISSDGKSLFVYKDEGQDGNIYLSKYENYEWSKPQALPYPVNTDDWETHACLSPDSKTLYFVSDRPGGFGGRDIYKCDVSANGEYGSAENLGYTINTDLNEDAPFILLDGKTMFFCSEGHESMGGFDIYSSKLSDDGFWSTPKNLGYPINTTEDDVFYVPVNDEKHAYYSSAKNGGNGDQDIYLITILKEKEEYALLKGKIFDPVLYKPIEAKIEIMDLTKNEVVANTFSNKKTGEFSISLKKHRKYGIGVEADNYLKYSENFDISDSVQSIEIIKNIPIKSAVPYTDSIFTKMNFEVGERFILTNIYFDFDKSELKKESLEEVDRLINLLKRKTSMCIEISGHTDNQGTAEYNLNLSERRAKAVMDYLVSNGIDAKRLSYKGYGFDMPIATNSTEFGRKVNRRTEFKIVSK